jgi:hypothetical protein
VATVTTSVKDLIDARPSIDTQETFDALWVITCELFDKVQKRFELKQDPCCDDLKPYHGKDGAKGYLSAYAGAEIDWLIHSYTGNPKASFTNMHLTIHLGQHIDVPNFGFALGTIPDIFWYMDTMPRRELLTDMAYVHKYWSGEPNEALLEVMGAEGFSPFFSRDTYTRVALSPNVFCFSAPPSATNIDLIRKASHAGLDRWLKFVDEAKPLAPSKRAALAKRDELIRKQICESDPANIVAEKIFGKELCDRLVSTLWGGTRTLPRPVAP